MLIPISIVALLVTQPAPPECPDLEALDAALDAKLMTIRPGLTLQEFKANYGEVLTPVEGDDRGERTALLLVVAERGSRTAGRTLTCSFDGSDVITACQVELQRFHAQRLDASTYDQLLIGMTFFQVRILACPPSWHHWHESGESTWHYSYPVATEGHRDGAVELYFGADGKLRRKQVIYR